MDSAQTTKPGRQSPTTQQPDKTIAILALVFAFVFPIVGLILSIINLKKYPKGTQGHGLNKAALILSIIFTLILPVLIAIGSLAYFGVLSPGNLLPERTVFKAPLMNTENAYMTSEGTLTIPLQNSQGSSILITGAASGTEDCAGATLKEARLADGTMLTSTSSITNGQRFIMEFNCKPQKKGDQFKATITFEYEASETGLKRMHTGDITATVR